MKTEYTCACGQKMIPYPTISERYELYIVIETQLLCKSCENIYHVSGIVYLDSISQLTHWMDQPKLTEVDDTLKPV